MSHTIRSLVKEFLKEDQAYKRLTGKKYTADIEMFRDNVNKPGYYIHLTDIPKLGVNPKSGYLPGIYLYPNTKKNYEAVFLNYGKGSVVAGGAARYAYLIKLRSDINLLEKADLNDYLDERFESIVKPILDDALDTRSMSVGPNVGKYFDKDGSFKKTRSPDSRPPRLEVNPSVLEELGNTSIQDNVEKIVEVAKEVKALSQLKGKEKSAAAVALNQKILTVMNIANISTQFRDDVLMRNLGDYTFETIGIKISKAGVASTDAVYNSFKGIVKLIANFADYDYRTDKFTLSPEMIKSLNDPDKKLGGKKYNGDALFLAAAEPLESTAEFYRSIMYAGGPRARSSVIRELIELAGSRYAGNALVGKNGKRISSKLLADKILNAILEAMSRPARRITKEDLKKKFGTEELNILLALGGGEFDGVIDAGTTSPSGPTIYGALGIEGQQTFILPPIAAKLEGGGPVVMIDRMEGLAIDKTPIGSTQGTAAELYQDKSPREIELSNRVEVPKDEIYRAKNAGKSISRDRERVSTARDYSKEDA